MARFNFRLQQFLSVKEQVEDQKEIEYGHAVQKLEEEKQKKKILEAQREEQINEFRTSLQETIKPADLRRYNNTLEYIKRRIKEQEQRIIAAEKFAEKKRLELIEAMKERKALESVKENALEEFNKAALLEEQKQIDELVSYKYAEKNIMPRGMSKGVKNAGN